jgi:glyoxylase-like metal-dependent hydrolase (beta-lactamase superfamily II)
MAAWYSTSSLGDGVTLIWEHAIKPFWRCNIWHVRGRTRDLLVDSGMGIRPLRCEIALLTGRPVIAVASHTHVDHIGGHHEFEHCAVHEAEAAILEYPDRRTTIADSYLTDEMFEERPPPGFSAASHAVIGAPVRTLLRGGDVIDLGDRMFGVLHLPGHSPGSIALWEAATGILFSGDVVYDGPLIDDFYHSVAQDYVASMARLAALPVRVVHAGHFASFGRERMVELAEDYVAGRRRPGNAESLRRISDSA